VKLYTAPFHLDAPPDVVFAYLTDLIESGGRCGLHDDRDRQGDPRRRGHHVSTPLRFVSSKRRRAP